MRLLTMLDTESVGPCPDVPVPPAARPRLLVRGSVHPAVRDAQRRMNTLHAAELAAGGPGLAGAPLVEDCVFGAATQRALIGFQQRVFPGVTAEHDGRLGPRTWAQFDRVAVPVAPVAPVGPPPSPVGPAPFVPPAPPSPAPTGPRPVGRPCCLLISLSLTGRSTAGAHGDGQPDIVYTGRAGFVDLGHLWDTCDVTAFAYTRIHRAGGAAGTRITTNEGEAVLTSAAPATEWLDLARAIADDDALAHEIVTYPVFSIGHHNSSFSPEDLCSNRLGTLVAARAITAGGPFVAEAERQLATLLTDLDGQSEAETRRAFGRISGRWVRATVLPGDDYLQRRNFTVDPWKAGHPSDAATPAFVVAPIPVSSTFDFTVTGGAFGRSDFAARIAAIRVDARARYGPGFDQP